MNDIAVHLLKEVYKTLPKYAGRFVQMARFVSSLRKNGRYALIEKSQVRVEAFEDLPAETVADTVERMEREGFEYMDLD
jgi:hypothetical protein